jgi:hypothetical protein
LNAITQWPERIPAVDQVPRFPGCPQRKVEVMANDQVDRPVVTSRTAGPSGAEVVTRILVLGFGLIQLVIGARIILLVLNARTTNDLVSGILNVSQVFVAPFEGILRTNSLTASGSVLDIAAIVALIGWTVVELIAIAAVGIFRRGPA